MPARRILALFGPSPCLAPVAGARLELLLLRSLALQGHICRPDAALCALIAQNAARTPSTTCHRSPLAAARLGSAVHERSERLELRTLQRVRHVMLP